MRKVLVIDDDPDIGRMLKMLLEYKGYSVTLLAKAGQASEILRNNNINLVIMDMLLSGTNGVDVCRGFKRDPSISFIPVIMMSAHPDAKNKCLDAGADYFVPKPFDMQEILLGVDMLISKSHTV